MTQRRYRIRFIARFDHMIDAPDDITARQIAEDLPGSLHRVIQSAEGGELRWNTIEALGMDE